MITKEFNKKKANLNYIFKIFFIFFIICFFLFFFLRIYTTNYLVDNFFKIIETFSQKYNYTLKEIEFVDSPNIKKEEIKKYFDKYYDKSIFIIPIKEISNKISKNKWIDSIYIKSDYNDKIIIEIKEVIPLGIFYYNESYFLFDENGKIIDKAKPKDFLKLILFKGIDSNIQAKIFLDLIPLNFQGEIKEAIYVNNRRWDVKLKNEITLKLGENIVPESLENYYRIYQISSNEDLKNIDSIDLRILKKAIIKFKDQTYD